MIRRAVLLASLLALTAAGCTSGEGGEATTTPPTAMPTATSPTPTDAVLPFSTRPFGEYRFVPLMDPDDPPYAGPETPDSLAEVRIAPTVRRALDADPAIERALAERGFVVVPADLRLFHFAYQGSRYEGWPVFVTTDAAFHVWHLVFDKVLRSLEQEVLLPRLEDLVAGLLEGAGAQASELAGTSLEDAASRVEQIVQVAAAELGIETEVGTLAAQERDLIDAHQGLAESPLVGGQIDYSVFTPRGHYTRNADLERYFVAMSVLGQLAFCLPGTIGCPGLEPTRLGILASRVLAGDPGLVELWRQIYEPTAFLVGLADDYTPLEVDGAATGGLDDATAFADDAAVQDVVDGLIALRQVLINPDRASIRVMGSRFVFDSFLLDHLIYPNVGTPEEPRTLPAPMDLPALFGSGFAHEVLGEAGETRYEGYDEQLEAMQGLLASRPGQDWGRTVYDAWLHALEPVFVEHGRAFPDFMRTEAWAAKAHQSGLGSYAELKHDTILYAKQPIGEGGDGLDVPERRNWVEPEPVVFGRLAATADLMRSGLEERGLLPAELRGLLADAVELFAFLERIARDELAGASISERDNERLTDIGHTLEAIFMRTSDQTAEGVGEQDLDAAIVADVASGGGEVLEVATGRIDRIYVLVPDDDGAFQVAVGGVYSFYGFTTEGERLSDDEWRSLLDAGEAPARPSWEEAMLPA
ncbi:MAG TPA: DUF3160 domain-containing protein [Actinomycetota bacterium]